MKSGETTDTPKMGSSWTEDQGMGFPERCVDCQGSASHCFTLLYTLPHFFEKISGNYIQRFVELLRCIMHHMCSICVHYVFYMCSICGYVPIAVRPWLGITRSLVKTWWRKWNRRRTKAGHTMATLWLFNIAMGNPL